ncbi:transglycosylase family protein [Ornithinimicrobium sp. Y1694]|uniref:transglycosylase family protein n=1 Tax=Ornithinimicrobium sp. Y1694 TaxID=3418590 RepID=UPI003CF94623
MKTSTKKTSTFARTVGTAGATLLLAGAGLLTATSAQAADTGIPVLEAIKQCESGGSYTAQNPTSTASGAYQFLDSTWQSMSSAAGYARAVDAPESVQDAAAIELYNAQGTTPWLASASCWQGMGFSATSGSGESTQASTTQTSTTQGGQQGGPQRGPGGLGQGGPGGFGQGDAGQRGPGGFDQGGPGGGNCAR